MSTADANLGGISEFRHQEGLLGPQRVAVDPFLLDVTDDDLLKEIDDNISQGKTDMQTAHLAQVGRVNTDYYIGDQLKRVDLYEWQQNSSIENRIFMAVETLIPIICANPGEPDIKSLFTPPLQTPDNPQNMTIVQEFTAKQIGDYLDMLTSVLLWDYDKEYNLSDKCKRVLRHWFIFRFGVLKARYDKKDGKTHFDVVHPTNIILPGPHTDKGWVAEYKEDTLADLIVLFPDAQAKIEKAYLTGVTRNRDEVLGTKVGYYEYWRDTFKVVKLDRIILEKIKNPYWDWDGVKRNVGQVAVKQNPDGTFVYKNVIEQVKYRIISRPRKPYFIFNFFRLNDNEYDDTGYVEQGRALQDEVNKRKRQISQMAGDSGLLIASGDGIEKEEFDKYDGSPRSRLWVASGDPLKSISRLPAAQVSPGMVNDLQDSRAAMDTLLGTNSNLRGQQTPNETAQGRNLLRQADISRLAPIIERFETFLQEVYEYDIQMRVLFQDEDFHVPQLTPTNADEDQQNLTFNRDRIPLVKVQETIIIEGKKSVEKYFKPIPLTVRVKSGSTIPKDPAAQAAQAKEEWQLQVIDPITYYEKTGLHNPQQHLERLIKWKEFPLALANEEMQEELIGLINRPIRRLSETIRYENAPPDIRRQIEQQAGLKPSDGQHDNPPVRVTEQINLTDPSVPPEIKMAGFKQAQIIPEDVSAEDVGFNQGLQESEGQEQQQQPAANQPMTLLPPLPGHPIDQTT
jgi:hypothetical protein